MSQPTGVPPLHSSYVAVPIACDALNAQAVAVREYHYLTVQVMAVGKDKFLTGTQIRFARFAGERSWRICFHGSLSAKRIGLLYSVVKEHERRNLPFTSYRERKVPFVKLRMKYFSFHTKTRLQSPIWIQKQDIFLLYIQHSPAKGILLTKTEKFFTFFFFRTI